MFASIIQQNLQFVAFKERGRLLGLSLREKEVRELHENPARNEDGVMLETKQISDSGQVGEEGIDDTQKVKELEETRETRVDEISMSVETALLGTKQIDDDVKVAEEGAGDVTQEVKELEESRVNELLRSDGVAFLGTRQIEDDSEVADEVACSLTQSRGEPPYSNAHDIVESTMNLSPVEACSDIYKLCKNMDAPGLRSYMVRCVKEHNIVHDKILDALRFASDPSKLVLDVSQSFFEKADKALSIYYP